MKRGQFSIPRHASGVSVRRRAIFDGDLKPPAMRSGAALSRYAIVLLEHGIADARLPEAVAVVEHVLPAAMLVDERIRDHHRIPALVRAVETDQMIEPFPPHAVG